MLCKKICKQGKTIRLKDYDYSKEGMYFITICIKDRKELLGNITNDKINLTKEGIIAEENIKNIEEIYSNIRIDGYVIMPNHIHMLLEIKNKNDITVSKIIKHYKTNVSREITYSIWQKSFYEHIVRDEKEYLKITEYIQNNVINWEKDKYF